MERFSDYSNGLISCIQLLQNKEEDIEKLIREVLAAIRRGGKILIAGNGGSAADAQHFAAELVGRFRRERMALPAIALTTDTSILTSVSNDYSYEKVFLRQVQSLGRAEDCLINISTSGNSGNLVSATQEAGRLGIKTLALLGNNGGLLANICDHAVIVPSSITSHIQECHQLIYHFICLRIDEIYADSD